MRMNKIPCLSIFGLCMLLLAGEARATREKEFKNPITDFTENRVGEHVVILFLNWIGR